MIMPCLGAIFIYILHPLQACAIRLYAEHLADSLFRKFICNFAPLTSYTQTQKVDKSLYICIHVCM